MANLLSNWEQDISGLTKWISKWGAHVTLESIFSHHGSPLRKFFWILDALQWLKKPSNSFYFETLSFLSLVSLSSFCCAKKLGAMPSFFVFSMDNGEMFWEKCLNAPGRYCWVLSESGRLMGFWSYRSWDIEDRNIKNCWISKNTKIIYFQRLTSC